MTIYNLIRNIAIFLLIGGLSACQTTADIPPWDLPKPDKITIVHQDMAIAAHAVEERILDESFSHIDPKVADWDWDNGSNRTIPMSNMTTADLTSLINGKYNIFANKRQDHWSVRYYATDGITYFCIYENGRYQEWMLNRYVATTPFGMAGIFHWDPKKEATPVPPEEEFVGWPFVADSDKGLFYSYYWIDKKWIPERGWIQKEYAAAFAEHCPNLPRISIVNNNQLGETFSDLIPEATAVRGFRTAFKNDPEDPLTANMYYWLYPPE